jgi:uracil-DNA glycosylase family 4
MPLSAQEQLIKLQAECKKCSDCSEICARRTNLVFGEGNPDSPLILIGEGPGEQEDKTGRPFVGRAGQLLERALLDNGLSRDDVYITNTLKCRACDWVDGKAKNRPPTESEAQNCRRWLSVQLQIIQPEIILCIGAPSANNLIHKNFKITKERGKYFPCEFAKAAIATLHPSYILRQQNQHKNDGGYAFLVADIARAWAAANEIRSKRSGILKSDE